MLAYSLLAGIFGGRFDNSFSACTFFLAWRSARVRQFHFFFFGGGGAPGSVHSGSVSSDDCGPVFSDELHVSLFSLISSHTMPGQHSQPTPTSLGQRYIYMRVQV